MRVLILGGTSEASRLATALAAQSTFAATLSLAGRTQNPAPSPLPMRIGGFGGVDGLRRYLRSEAIAAVVDATHPFAAEISRNAGLACAAEQVPLIAFTRPRWPRHADDDWVEVATIEAALHAIGPKPRRVFLTQGRLQLEAFAAAPQHRYVVRAIDSPAGIDALRDVHLILSRGPFALDDEIDLMRREGIEILVSKNSGASATYPKIEAARKLGLRVIMLQRPQLPSVETAFQIEDVLRWLETARAARQ